MKNYYIILFLSSFINCYSQVGVGTTTPNGALDINSNNQGLLTPRVALTASNIALPVVNPAGGALTISTLVYNTATSGTTPNNVIPGYYYWDGTKWLLLTSQPTSINQDWAITGNSGTNSSTNFIGTTDNIDFVFKRNNLISGKLTTSNTSFGVEALSNSGTTALRTVAIGVNSLKNLTSGSDNVATGYGALEANTTGIQNVAVGSSSLSLNTSGSYNTAIGYNALTRNASGILNTAVGNSSLFNNLGGNNNVGLGYSALQRNFSGSYNVGVGTNAIFNNQTGNNNVGIGESALERNTNGSNNIAIGTSSLFNNQGSSNNTSIGHESQLNNLTGQSNTSLGYQSLFTNSGGSNNTAIGFQTLYLNQSGSRNTTFGESSGYNITSGNNNTFVGYNTGTTISTGSNNTIIGSNISLPAATSNNIVLADGAGNRRINVDANGNVGVGTTTQTVKLEVNGAAANSSTFNAGASTTIDLATSNLATTSASSNAITLTNLKDGAAYTIIFSSTTATAGNVVFTAPGFTFTYMSTFPRVPTKRHIYSIIVSGTVCYVSMSVEN